MDIPPFIHLSIDGYSGCFHLIVTRIAMNMHVVVIMWKICLRFFWVYILRRRIGGWHGSFMSSLWRPVKLFLTVYTQYICNSTVHVFHFLPILVSTSYFLVVYFLIIVIIVGMKYKWLLFIRPFLVSSWEKSPFKVEEKQGLPYFGSYLERKEISKETDQEGPYREGVLWEPKALIPWCGPMSNLWGIHSVPLSLEVGWAGRVWRKVCRKEAKLSEQTDEFLDYCSLFQ